MENKKKKAPFGGRTVTFKGATDTAEEIFGSAEIAPSQMVKKIWDYVKENKRLLVPDQTPLQKYMSYLDGFEFEEDFEEKGLISASKAAGVGKGALSKMSEIFKLQESDPGNFAIKISDLITELVMALEAKEAEDSK